MSRMTTAYDGVSDANRTLQEESDQTPHGAMRGGGTENGNRSGRSVRPLLWRVNVAPPERAASALVGGLLVGLATARPSPLRLVGAAGGAMLLARGLTGHCMGYAAMRRSTASNKAAAATPHDYDTSARRVEVGVTVDRPAAELWAYWRQLENLPRFMEGLETVTQYASRRSRWVAKAPAGTSVTWDAEVVSEEEHRLLAWKSLPGADVDNAGSVRFTEAPGNRGTEVRVTIDYIPPGGAVGAVVAKLFGRSPQSQVKEDLRRFKQLMEAGELPTISGQPRGRKC